MRTYLSADHSPGNRCCKTRPSLTVARRRHALTNGRSIDKTINPSGIIQNPRTGKNPRMPPTINRIPIRILSKRLAGSCRRRLPNFKVVNLLSPLALSLRHKTFPRSCNPGMLVNRVSRRTQRDLFSPPGRQLLVPEASLLSVPHLDSWCMFLT